MVEHTYQNSLAPVARPSLEYYTQVSPPSTTQSPFSTTQSSLFHVAISTTQLAHVCTTAVR